MTTRPLEEIAMEIVASFHRRGNTGLTQLEFDIAAALREAETRGLATGIKQSSIATIICRYRKRERPPCNAESFEVLRNKVME